MCGCSRSRPCRRSSDSTRGTNSWARTTSSPRSCTPPSAVIPGIYNVAADGVLALTEVISLLGKYPAPILPAWGTRLAATPLRAMGLPITSEMLAQLRYGRGLDNRKLKQTGFRYEYTTREAVLKLRERQRLGRLLEADEPFHYEAEVEEFLRRSPHVRR